MIPWFRFTTFYLGPIPIQVWGLFVSLGMILTLLIIWYRGGSVRERLLDLALYMIVGGIVGARLFHVTLYQWDFYLAHPGEIIAIWHGGLSSFGGIAGAVCGFGLYIFYNKHLWPNNAKNIRQTTWLRFADIISFAALYGWMVGRVGCFMIHDHLGVHSTSWLAINMPGGARFDMALMEIFGLVPLALFFIFLRKKVKPAGWFLLVLFVYYGLLRFVLDFYRAIDIVSSDARYAGLTPAQYFAIVLVFFGVYGLWKIRGANGRVA
jgi:phosphatidylglycerol:prolipoprotein diacylglycerol transferase